jgi:hypothetical protein
VDGKRKRTENYLNPENFRLKSGTRKKSQKNTENNRKLNFYILKKKLKFQVKKTRKRKSFENADRKFRKKKLKRGIFQTKTGNIKSELFLHEVQKYKLGKMLLFLFFYSYRGGLVGVAKIFSKKSRHKPIWEPSKVSKR